MAAHGDDTAKAASGAGIVADGKRKIKKLTADKIRENLQQITKKNGEVDLTGHGIESIISLDGLQNATKLNLSHNKITKLSDMKRVQNITMLKLIDNKLNGEGLAELQYLKKLVILNVAENQVARVPSEVLRNLRTLKALVLNNNSITTLEWIPKFPELNSLIVSNNRISQFPARTMDHLPALTKISMSHNLLEEIPDFSVLSELTELRLSHNKIKKIPFSLAKLKNLRVLELGHNEIDDWKGVEALSRLENLKQLNLSGNPIVGQPLEVVKKGAKPQEKKKTADEDDDDESSSSSSDEEEEKLTAEEKVQRKEAKRLDAKHKQYNFKMKRLFPKLVIRDGQRVLDKRTHGYIAPPKEEKKPKRKHEDREQKKTKNDKKDKKNEKDEASERKEKKRKTDKSSSDTAESAGKKSEKLAETVPQKSAKAAEDAKKQVDVVMEPAAAASAPVVVDTPSASVGKPKKDDKKKKPSKDDKQKKHQSKDSASGVVAVKQFNKSKKAKKERQALDLTKLDFAPNGSRSLYNSIFIRTKNRTVKTTPPTRNKQAEQTTRGTMAQNPLTAFIGSFMAPKHAADEDVLKHLAKTADGAKWRLDDDAPAHRPKGYHQQAQYTSPEGFPEVPRRYTMPSHSADQDFETYAANSYSSAIAIQEVIKKRGF